MPKKRKLAARHPFDGESADLWTTKDVIAGSQRLTIENNYRWVQRQKDREATKILAPGFAQEDTRWSDHAECRNADPETFFPETNEQKAAKAWESYCTACPVIEQCRDYAERHQEQGIWGNQAMNMTLVPHGRPRGFYEPGSASARRSSREAAKRQAAREEAVRG